MAAKSWRGTALVCLLILVVPAGGRAEQIKATDEGKMADFKGKTFDLQPREAAAVTLEFEAGKRVRVHVHSDRSSDVNLYIYNAEHKLVAKDDGPSQHCLVNFVPAKTEKLTLLVRNLGPIANRSSLSVGYGPQLGGGSRK